MMDDTSSLSRELTVVTRVTKKREDQSIAKVQPWDFTREEQEKGKYEMGETRSNASETLDAKEVDKDKGCMCWK